LKAQLPQRIVCLTEETTETLYTLGLEDRIVGISGFTVRPAKARKEKPKVSAFTSAKIDKILALEPDLVIGFSDMQADIAADLIRAGVNVWITNQRSVSETLSQMLALGVLVGAEQKTRQWVAELETQLATAAKQAATLPRRPRVYFEEWDEPMISAIRWVSELIEIAGGTDVFSELSHSAGAKGRFVTAEQVITAQPDIIIGSWCGKKFQPGNVARRAGFDAIPAVRNGALHEIKSPLILQPGPAALTDGLAALQAIIRGGHQDSSPGGD